jgi:hypothetical protein
MQQQSNFDEKQSLQLITDMINKTKQSFHETGFGPIMWGSVIAICSITTFCSLHFDFKLPFDIWLLTLVALIPQIIYIFKESKRKTAKTYNDIAMDYTWTAFGISIFILSITLNNISYDLKNSIPNYMQIRGNFRFFNHTTALHLLIYGIPTFITGGVMKFKPMLYGGILCWVLAIVSNFTSMKTDMLLMALAVIVAWLIPGLLLNAKYRKQKAINV